MASLFITFISTFSFLHVCLVSKRVDETKDQPTLLTVMTACALFGGPVLTYRAFKQSAPRNIYNLVIVFVKEDPDKVQWPKDICCLTDYRALFHQAVNKSITIGIKQALIASNCVPDGMFADIE